MVWPYVLQPEGQKGNELRWGSLVLLFTSCEEPEKDADDNTTEMCERWDIAQARPLHIGTKELYSNPEQKKYKYRQSNPSKIYNQSDMGSWKPESIVGNHGRDATACSYTRDGWRKLSENMRGISDESGKENQEQKSPLSQDILDIIPEDDEEVQVTNQVKYVTMQKKRSKERQATVSEEIGRYKAPVFDNSFKIKERYYTNKGN